MSQNIDKPANAEAGNMPPAQQATNPADHSVFSATEEKQLRRLIDIKLKKNWKEYILEFVLVLAAVSLGFLADSLREKKEDRQREKKYIRSFLADLQEDRSMCLGLGTSIEGQLMKIDSLEQLLLSGPGNNPTAITKCYELFNKAFSRYPQFFNQKTVTQLLSSGNMRLIENYSATDSIMSYYSHIKFLETVREAYMETIADCRNDIYDFIDIGYGITMMNDSGLLVIANPDLTGLKLKSYDEEKLRKFIIHVELAKVQCDDYLLGLLATYNKAEGIYNAISKAYNIKK